MHGTYPNCVRGTTKGPSACRESHSSLTPRTRYSGPKRPRSKDLPGTNGWASSSLSGRVGDAARGDSWSKVSVEEEAPSRWEEESLRGMAKWPVSVFLGMTKSSVLGCGRLGSAAPADGRLGRMLVVPPRPGRAPLGLLPPLA